MLTPVPSTLPDSTLSPSDIMAKFSPQSLAGLGHGPFGFAGLGCGCSESDENGDCLDPDPCVPDTSDLPINSPTLPLYPVVAPGTTPVTTVSGGTSTSSLCSSSNSSDQALCNLLQTGTGSTSTSSSSGGLTNTQLASLASQLAAGASQAAILSQLPAGYSIKNGSIVAPSTSLLSGSSGTILLFLAIGVGLFIAMEKK
jgi:hypothetical protein